MIVISEDQANQFMFSTLGHPGVCVSCKMIDEFAGCEPDAESYECPECGQNSLMGFERALEMGIVELK